MPMIDIVLTTTYSTTSAIQLPGGMPPIAFVPTSSHFLQGIAGFKDLLMTRYSASMVRFNKIGVKYNVVKVKYRAVGEVVRT